MPTDDVPEPRGQPLRTSDHHPTGPDSTVDQTAHGTDSASQTPNDGATRWPSIPGYDILGELGRGGMGVVYHARQATLHRDVAVKTIRGANATDRVSVARFWAEAEVMAAARHPHVTQVYELGECDGVPFLAMELLTGDSLAHRLRHPSVLRPREAAELMVKIARGVAAAHDLGIVHRDLKPGNILFDAGGEPKVTDFGLAKWGTSDLTQTDAVMGTPAYMAPEQAGGRSKFVGPPADVWALGVILYQCLTGRRPFEGDSTAAILHRIVSEEPTPLRRVARGVPRDLATIVEKSLTKEPGGRYPTAGELADDLERFLAGRPILARPLGPLQRTWRWSRRNPVVATLLVAQAILLGLAVWSWRGASRSAESEQQARIAEQDANIQAGRDRDAALRGRALSLRNEALSAGERGDGARTLLLLAQAVDSAARANDPDLERSLRLHFAAWHQTIPTVQAILSAPHRIRSVTVSPDSTHALLGGGPDFDTVVATGKLKGVASGEARLWDLGTGQPAGPILAHPWPVVATAFRLDGTMWTLDVMGQSRFWNATTGVPQGNSVRVVPTPILYGQAIPDGPRANRVAIISEVRKNEGMVEKAVTVVVPGQAQPPYPPLVHGGNVDRVIFSADGSRLATVGGEPTTVQLWDAATGRPVGTRIQPPQDVRAVVFHPRGLLFVASGDGRVRVWKSTTGESVPTMLGHEGELRALAISSDGRVVATVGDGVRFYFYGGNENRTVVRSGVTTMEGGLTEAVFSPDGRFLAVTSNSPHAAIHEAGRVILLDVRSSRQVGSALRLPSSVAQLTFTADGRSLIVRTQAEAVYQWAIEPRTGYGPGPDGDNPTAWASTPDGDSLLFGVGTKARFYDTATGTSGPELVHPAPIYQAAFRPDGQQAVVGTEDGHVLVWDRRTGQQLGTTLRIPAVNPTNPKMEWVDTLDLGREGGLVGALRTGVVGWWPSLSSPPVIHHQLQARPLSFSPDGRWLLSAAAADSRDGRGASQLGELKTGPPAAIRPHGPAIPGDSPVIAEAWRPDGQQFALAYYGGTVVLWDVAAGRRGPLLHHPARAAVLRYSADGSRLLTATHGGAVRLWDTTTGEAAGPVMAHPAPCFAAALSPNGRMAACGYDGGVVQFWELATGRPLGAPRSHHRKVEGVMFTAGGRRLVTVGGEGLARTLDVPEPAVGIPAALMRRAERATGLALGPDEELVPLTPTEWAARASE